MRSVDSSQSYYSYKQYHDVLFNWSNVSSFPDPGFPSFASSYLLSTASEEIVAPLNYDREIYVLTGH